MEQQKITANNGSKRIARIVGILFIIGTASGILSFVFMGTILDDKDYLVKVFENQDRIATSALCILVMGLSLAFVPVVIYPVLKKQNGTLALGYLVFRGALETLTYTFSVMALMLLIILSRENANISDPSYLKTMGTLLLEGMDYFGALTAIVFSLGAMMLYYVFYRSRLIPRWITTWGIVAAILYLVAGVSRIYSTDLEFLYFVMLPQEMVMAAYLIIKGFGIPKDTRDPVVSGAVTC